MNRGPVTAVLIIGAPTPTPRSNNPSEGDFHEHRKTPPVHRDHAADHQRDGAEDHDDGNGRGRAVYESKVLVSNGGIPANFTDPNLLNGWGVAFNPNGFVWVSAEGSGKSVLYDGNGQPQSLVVAIPGPGGAAGSPTGIVFSGGADFVVTNGTTNGPARFLFATEQGTIAGWAPNVNATNALTAVDNSSRERGLHRTGSERRRDHAPLVCR